MAAIRLMGGVPCPSTHVSLYVYVCNYVHICSCRHMYILYIYIDIHWPHGPSAGRVGLDTEPGLIASAAYGGLVAARVSLCL